MSKSKYKTAPTKFTCSGSFTFEVPEDHPLGQSLNERTDIIKAAMGHCPVAFIDAAYFVALERMYKTRNGEYPKLAFADYRSKPREDQSNGQ